MGSAYALQSIGGGKGMRGFVGIGSGNDSVVERKKRGSEYIRSGDMESSSEELNALPMRGIHKTTEVVVSRELRTEGDLRMHSTYVEK